MDFQPLALIVRDGFDFYEVGDARLAKREGGVSEKVVDAQELREGAGVGIGALRVEHRIAEPSVLSRHDLPKQFPVISVSWLVEAQPARRKRGHDAPAFCFEKLFRQRIEVGK